MSAGPAAPLGRVITAAAPVASVAALAAMLATPFVPVGRRRTLTNAVVLAGAVRALALECRGAGRTRASVTAAGLTASAWMVEELGTRTGAPFGRYAYTGRLRPAVMNVPVAVPLAWYAVAVPAGAVGRAMVATPGWRRRAVGAAALTAWDLFLDPQMIAEGYWRWEQPGGYRGVPLVNFAGWLLVAFGMMSVIDVMRPDARDVDRQHVATYVALAALEGLAFALFFRDRRVAIAGSIAMAPFAIAAGRRSWTRSWTA